MTKPTTTVISESLEGFIRSIPDDLRRRLSLHDCDRLYRLFEQELQRQNEELKTLILQFVASLTLCDHMGDVRSDVCEVLKRLNIKSEWEEWHDLGRALGKMGVTTLYGTQLGDDDE